jgi:hypothetical protein
MEAITLDHIKKAAEWAANAGSEPLPLDGLTRRYDQSDWDCGTACCMWGAASILAGCGPASVGPSSEWSGQDLAHTLVAGIMRNGTGTPQQMIDLLTNLSGADLSEANLSGADLRGADLREAGLREANLSGANLRGADLRGADLREAGLREANLSGANLREANLRGADLRGANLREANLSEANLSGANLRGADLREAGLNGAEIKIGNVYRKIQ